MADDETNPFVIQFDGEDATRAYLHRDGKATATYSNGDTYVGNFVNGNKHDPRATYQFTSLNETSNYVGGYEKGLRHGQGNMTYPDQSTYNGQWVNGQREGHGVYVYPNGDQYIGSWRNDQRDGEGRYLFAKDRTEFVGVWTNGVCTDGQWEVYAGKAYVAQVKQGQVIGYV